MTFATKQRSVDQAILDLAESLEPKYQRAFLEAIERLRGRVDIQALVQALQAGSLAEIEAALSLDTLDQELKVLTDRALEAIQKGGRLTAGQVSRSAGAVLAFDIANPRALEAVRRVGGDLVREITETTRLGIRAEIGFQFLQGRAPMQTAHVLERRLGLTQYQMGIVRNYEATLRDAVRGEITFGELQRRYTLNPVRGPGGLQEARIEAAVRQYEARLLALRAEMIARTETIRATETGRQEAWRQAQEAGVLEFDQLREWLTAEDERVCFPAGVKYEIPKGSRVTAMSRRPVDTLSVLFSNKAVLPATPNHPLWDGEGWRKVSDFKPGDLLYFEGDETAEVVGRVDLLLLNPNHNPSSALDFTVAPYILRGIVPVRTIDLDGDSVIWQSEVYRPPSKPVLLGVVYGESIEGLTNSALQQGFPTEGTIAREATELAVEIARQAAECIPAVSAGFDLRWASAFLGAVMAGPLSLGGESLAARLTILVDGGGESAFAGTDSIAVDVGQNHPEGLPTFGAGLDDAGAALEGPATLTATGDRLGSSQPVGWTPNGGPAFLAWNAASELGVAEPLIRMHGSFCHFTVYNIQVEPTQEYMAEGVRVHNCPICQPLDGKLTGIERPFPGGVMGPPAHPGCRCSTVLVFSD